MSFDACLLTYHREAVLGRGFLLVIWEQMPVLFGRFCMPPPVYHPCPEAEFLDIIGKITLRVFLLAIHSHLY